MKNGLSVIISLLALCFVPFPILANSEPQEQMVESYWEWEIGYKSIEKYLYLSNTPDQAIQARNEALKKADPFVHKIVLDSKANEKQKNTWFLLQIGWKRIQYDSAQSALERLTWAWFIAPEDPMIYWAIASALGSLDRLKDSVKLFTIAEHINHENQGIDKTGQSLSFNLDFAHSLNNYWDSQEHKDKHLLTKAEKLLKLPREKSISNNNDCCCIRAMYSVVLFNQERYKESYAEYQVVKSNTPQCRNLEYEKELDKKHAE